MFHLLKRKSFFIFTFILILLTVTLRSPELQTKAKNTTTTQYNMKVHFIDVGQADCILIESNKKYMLIDAGNNDDEKLILTYLKKNKVKRLEYVIGTHPHEECFYRFVI